MHTHDNSSIHRETSLRYNPVTGNTEIWSDYWCVWYVWYLDQDKTKDYIGKFPILSYEDTWAEPVSGLFNEIDQEIADEKASEITIPAEASFKAVLQLIDRWAARASGRETRQLWAVLTALRGPDNSNYRLKYSTTAVIRAKSLPKLAADLVLLNSTTDRITFPEDTSGTQSNHFRVHILNAAEALGLKVDP